MTSGHARLFVALELLPGPRRALVHWQAHAVADRRGIRAVAPEALHVTLCFLGSRAVAEIGAILAACESAPDTPDGLALGEPVWLPARRPRVLAISVQDPRGALAELQGALSDALSAGGWYTPESRVFRPHVTVARVAKGAHAGAVELAPVAPLSLDGARVTLYRSRPGSGGARYEALGHAKLETLGSMRSRSGEETHANSSPVRQRSRPEKELFR